MVGLRNITNRLDYTLEGLIYILLTFMPLTFGAVMPWSEQVVVVLAALIALVMFVQSLYKHYDFIQPTILLVIFFFLVGGLQLLKLPVSIIEIISPATLELKSDLLSVLNQQDSLEAASISFYENSTLHILRLFASVGIVFIATVFHFDTLDRIKRLLTVIAVVAGFVSLLALMQQITLADKIYWLVPLGHKYANSGTFVNHSNYGQYMNLSIGATLALIMIILHQRFSGIEHTPKVVFEYLGSFEGRRVLVLTGFIIVGAATIFLSLTRGGMIALIVSGLVTTGAIACSKVGRSKGWIMVFVALLAFMCVLYVGFDAVYDRLATLEEVDKVTNDRRQIVADIIEMSKVFPLFGTGLGTHPVVYPIFENSNITSLAYHAENEYAQAIEETGYIGFLTLVAFLVFIIAYYFKCTLRCGVESSASFAAYGLGFGVLAILIQSLSDFGQHLPSNGGLTAISCGLIVAISRIDVEKKIYSIPSRVLITLILGLAVCAFVFFGIQADKYRRAWANYTKARDIEKVLEVNEWQGSESQYIEMITFADQAVKIEPNNVKFRHWLNIYRWRMLSKQVEALDLLNVNNSNLSEQIKGIVVRLVDEFKENIKIAPTFGKSWTMIGQLEYFAIGRDEGLEYINIGRKLAPNDPLTAYIAGLLETREFLENSVSEGQSDLSDGYPGFVHFSRAIELNGNYFRTIADIYIDQLNMPQAAVELCGDNVYRLNYVANLLVNTEQVGADLAKEARDKVYSILNQKSMETNASSDIFASLASIYEKEGNIDKAIENYEKALNLNYGQISWRMKYASLLAEAGQKDAAIHQARIVLRIKPGHSGAVRLIGKLVTE